MSKRIEQYIPVSEIRPDLAKNPRGCSEKTNFIQLAVSYSLGGVNYFTGGTSPRGYYLVATPVERSKSGSMFMIGSILGSGIKDCLLEVSRQSDRQMGIACSLAEERAKTLLEWCKREYGLCYDEPDAYFPNAQKIPVPSNLQKPRSQKVPSTQPVKPIRTMKLLTSEIIRKLEKHPFGSQDGNADDAKVLVKFFGGGACTWLITEGERQEDDDWLMYGKVTLGADWEWGYVLLSELEELKFPPFGLGVERDMYLANDAKVGDLCA